MARFLYRLGRFCAAHALPVVVVWAVIALGMVAFLAAGGSTTSNDLSLPGTESQAASDLLAAKFPPQQNGSNPIVFHVSRGKVTDKANEQAIEASYKALLKAPDVYSATDPFKNSAAGLVSADGTTAFTPVLLSVSNGEVTEELAKRIFDATEPAQKQGIEVAAGGTIGSVLSASPTEKSEIVGLATAMVILAFTFGSLVAMGLPILTAVLGLILALGLIGALSHLLTIPVVGPTLATMIGLGVGIDYSLFLTTRYRRQVEQGADPDEALARAVATAGSAIVFAGSTVVIALLSLSVAGIPLVSALGYATAVAVLTAVCAAITLLPAVLSLLGRHAFAARLPSLRRRPAGAAARDAGGAGIWRRWGNAVTGHPGPFAVLALAILIPLIIPLFDLHLGQEDIGVSPPGTTERQAFDLMSKSFGPGYNGPLLVAVSLSPKAAPSQQYESQYKQAQALQSDLQTKQKTLNDQADALQAQQAQLLRQKQQLQSEQAALLQQQKQLVAQQAQLEAERTQLLAEKAALPQRRAQLQSRRAALERQRVALAAQLKAASRTQARLQVELSAVLAVEQRLQAGLSSHSCAAHPNRPICLVLQRLLARAHAREQTVRAAIATNTALLQSLHNQAQQLAAEARQLARDAASLVGDAARLEQQAAELQRQADALQAQAASLQRQAAALQAQAASLQSQASALQAQADQLKAQQHDAELEQKQAIALKQTLTDEMTYAGGDDRGTDPRLVELEDALHQPTGVVRVSPPNLNKAGDAATFTVIPQTRPADRLTADLVAQIRDSVIPPVLHDTHGLTVDVGGVTAANVDLASKISAKLFIVIGVVLVLSFLLLMTAFRSLLIPLQAAITNLLCVGAAFGVLTAVFQWGWGLSLVGLSSQYGTVPIASYVPLMMFAALFGLSMDYEVFLVSQIAQHHARGEDPRAAIRSGVIGAAKVISAAALIMIAVFASFIVNPDPTVKQFGVGLSVAVLLAGAMVLLLAPAMLTVFARFMWSMPRWLDRVLPRIDVEGEAIDREQPQQQPPQQQSPQERPQPQPHELEGDQAGHDEPEPAEEPA